MAFLENDFLNARNYLLKYYKNPKPDIFLPGTVKMLSKISLDQNDKEKALSLLDQLIKNIDSTLVKVDLKIYKANLLIKTGDNKTAAILLEDLLNNKDISSANKNEIQELLGMI